VNHGSLRRPVHRHKRFVIQELTKLIVPEKTGVGLPGKAKFVGSCVCLFSSLSLSQVGADHAGDPAARTARAATLLSGEDPCERLTCANNQA
jgi:hypothetical protein